MNKYKELDKKMGKCIDEMQKPIVEISKKHGIDITNGAMLELALRMMLMRQGSTQVLYVFASTIANLVEKGPLLEAYMQDTDIDEVEWLKNGALVKPTIH